MADLERFFRHSPDLVLDAAADALVVEGNEAMVDAKQQTPVDLGVLRASGTVFPVERSRTGASIELGFGGAASGYAVVQHERLDYHHPTGKAKFLEDPVLKHATTLGRTIANEVERALRKFAR